MNAFRIPDASVLTGWRKSSYSGSENQDCVEVTRMGGHFATRDSKNPNGPALVFTQDAWASFVGAVASGAFDNA
ncbi:MULTISPECIES: DUF397 domain-containing protein [Streptomycetaceae]|jgi:hypothetical protein|uniref:DUF397 domain-containing protein n=1 Tax=Streptomycetaceae TaxID=2062 RepID=UPI0030093C25